ncbi:hypothetical protein [Candidatus Nanobsidianus stetteri]|uniref:Uncharacterized protein n=1 Tax=Nanobsidianus stetteri TaxID=1294122 RepID=A0A2T9WL31_NANST|nr:hypothetical protein [Candidatus Nanobsidianus stetteri]MCC5447277.1 hypothetical protein [Candidatus Nanobsidianus stetteri]
MALDPKSLSKIVSSYYLDLSELKLKDERPLDEKSFQISLDELLESYGSNGYLAYILLRNVKIIRTKDYNGEYMLYSPLEKIISEETINIIFRDSTKYDEIKKSIDIYAKNGELYLPQKLKGKIEVEAEIDALVIARGYSGEPILYNFEFKSDLKKNINDKRYIKAHLQLFRSSIVLIYALLKAGIISKDSKFYIFSILSSRDWYRPVYLSVYNRDLYVYYINHKDKSIKYQIPLSGADLEKYANYSKDDFEYSIEKRGLVECLLGLGCDDNNNYNHKKRR